MVIRNNRLSIDSAAHVDSRRSLIRDVSGAAYVEYVVLLLVISVGIFGSVYIVGIATQDSFSKGQASLLGPSESAIDVSDIRDSSEQEPIGQRLGDRIFSFIGAIDQYANLLFAGRRSGPNLWRADDNGLNDGLAMYVANAQEIGNRSHTVRGHTLARFS